MENMSYEFKDMATIEVAEEVSESANVLIEDGGVIKRMSKSAVGKVKTVNGTEPDENGNIEVDTVSSWNDLKSKPFYEEEKKEMIIDSYEHVFMGEVLVDDWDKEYVEYSGLDIDGADFNETWTTGEELYLLCNGVEYKGVVEINKAGEMIRFDSAEISHMLLPNEKHPDLFTVYTAEQNDPTKLELPVTFSLYRKSTEVKQLDAKFIPANCDMIIEVPRHSAMDLNIGVENVVVNDINNVIELMKQGKLVNVVIKVVHAYSDTVYTHQISPTQILYKENGAFEELSGLHIYWICNANNECIDSPVLYKLVWNGKNVARVEKTPISTMSGAS